MTFVVNADPEADFSVQEARHFAGERKSPPLLKSRPNSEAWPGRTPPDHEYEVAFTAPTGLDALSAAASGDHRMLSHNASQPSSSSHAHPTVTLSETLQPTDTPSTNRSTSTISPPSNNSYFSRVLNPGTQGLMTPPIDPNLAFLQNPKPTPLHNDDFETSHEVAFLLRHFSEGPGPTMDLFDIQKYFTNYVPVKAMTNPILKNATCAYAAKQLGLVKGRKPVMGGPASTQAPTELFPNMSSVDWAYKGTQYYDKAIELLMQAIREGIVGIGRSSPDDDQSAIEEAMSTFNSTLGDKRKFRHDRSLSDSQMPTYEWKKRRKVSQGRALSDEMTAATAILCDYELQEGSGLEWQRHLDGTKSLLDIVEGSMMPLQAPLVMPRPLISRARQATFWNFARQDFLSALINETQTRLDTEDLPMWKDAGLSIDENGFIKPSNVSAHGLPEGPHVMKEDMIANALIWIMGKIVNFAVAADTGPSEGRHIWEGINAAAMHEKWVELKTHLENWYAGLPDSFKPCAQLHPSMIPSRLASKYGDDGPVFTEIWYNIPMCASTMQSYHMARMLMLLNMPQHSTFRKTTFHKRLTGYRSITQEIEAHALAICGIASSRPDSAVRIHSVQPLFTAGQSLNTVAEKKGLLRMLREIERDTGWATQYRVRRLCEDWEWPTPDGPGRQA